AESPELVFASCATLVPQSRRAVQSFHRTHRAVVLFRTRAALLLGRCNYDFVSNHADPERQSLLAQLHHDRALYCVLRRSLPRASTLIPPPFPLASNSVAPDRGRLG